MFSLYASSTYRGCWCDVNFFYSEMYYTCIDVFFLKKKSSEYFSITIKDQLLKGATPWFVYLEKFNVDKCLARVQKVDNTVHRMIHYPANSVVCFVNIYPLDSDLSGK